MIWKLIYFILIFKCIFLIDWCVALDVTPVQLTEDSIQVLVRMRTYFYKQNAQIYFYVVATHKSKFI